MKKLIIALAALMVSISAYGQGQFVFNNRVGSTITARFILSTDPSNGSSSSIGSPDWTVQLFGGKVGDAVSALVPLDPAGTTFRGAAGSTTAGYVTGVNPTIPGTTPGGSGLVLVKILGPNGFSQSFGPYTVDNLGGGTITPPNLTALGTSPLVVTVVPEPATLALGALGVGALLLIRRRK
ncbi:MAG: PEP-CTERM sorting domain-containing protein [Verrucomicrobiota bacterium]